MIDSSSSYHEVQAFCEHHLVPLTFETCNYCDKVYHPHDTRPGRCLCGQLKAVTIRRFPTSMLIKYVQTLKDVYQWT